MMENYNGIIIFLYMYRQVTNIMASIRRMRKRIKNNLVLSVPPKSKIIKSYINKSLVNFSSKDIVNLFILGEWEKEERDELDVIIVTEKEELPTFEGYVLDYVTSFSGTYAWFHIFIKNPIYGSPIEIPDEPSKKKTSKKSTKKKTSTSKS